MEFETIKETFEDLRIVKNGSSLGINLPARFVKKHNLIKGNSLTCTFELELLKTNNDNKILKKLLQHHQDLIKGYPALKKLDFSINDLFEVMMITTEIKGQINSLEHLKQTATKKDLSEEQKKEMQRTIKIIEILNNQPEKIPKGLNWLVNKK